jgi:8-oxo-dGTP diphosphatase
MMARSSRLRQTGMGRFSAGSGISPMAGKPYCYEYPRPAVTVDAVVFGLRAKGLSVVLIERRHEPFAGRLALPGGFLEMDEPAETAARRELAEETGLNLHTPFRPLGFYDAPGRDPRGRTISLAFVALAGPDAGDPTGGDDAQAAAWYPLSELAPDELAFDHAVILSDALALLRRLAAEGAPLLELLPDRLPREALRSLFRALGQDARAAAAWRRRMEAQGLLRPAGTGGTIRVVRAKRRRGRPAR